MAKVSVIVPIYNGIEYLDSLLSCLFAQTLKDIEFILVDDGSVDGTWEKISAVSDARFKTIKISHSGPSVARNVGLSQATGQYVRFVDSDDYIVPNSCELLLNAAISGNYDLVAGNFTYDDPNNDYYQGPREKSSEISPDDFVRDFLKNSISYYYGVVWNKLYKASIIKDNNILFDETISWSEDYAFNVNYFRYCDNFYCLINDEGIYKYIRRESSITMNIDEMSKSEAESFRQWKYEITRPFCQRWGVEHELLLAINFNELRFRLNDLVLENGLSVSACKAQFDKEMTRTGIDEYLKNNPMPKSFVFYYTRGMLRKLLRHFIPAKNWKGKK